jgi:hypothetical protein
VSDAVDQNLNVMPNPVIARVLNLAVVAQNVTELKNQEVLQIEIAAVEAEIKIDHKNLIYPDDSAVTFLEENAINAHAVTHQLLMTTSPEMN